MKRLILNDAALTPTSSSQRIMRCLILHQSYSTARVGRDFSPGLCISVVPKSF